MAAHYGALEAGSSRQGAQKGPPSFCEFLRMMLCPGEYGDSLTILMFVLMTGARLTILDVNGTDDGGCSSLPEIRMLHHCSLAERDEETDQGAVAGGLLFDSRVQHYNFAGT